jgi:hypothetical protein
MEYSILLKIIILVIGYLLTFWLTNLLIKKLITKDNKIDADGDGDYDIIDQKLIKDGYIIGKCENIIILTLVLADALTGLALIFAAKNLARQKDINDNAGFFLAGTMVNFTASLMIAIGLKFILQLV